MELEPENHKYLLGYWQSLFQEMISVLLFPVLGLVLDMAFDICFYKVWLVITYS